jgi:hypothetical protein
MLDSLMSKLHQKVLSGETIDFEDMVIYGTHYVDYYGSEDDGNVKTIVISDDDNVMTVGRYVIVKEEDPFCFDEMNDDLKDSVGAVCVFAGKLPSTLVAKVFD